MAGSSDSSGNWLMTYADFITLMMIFFIVLYTFTPGVEKNKFEAIIGAFQGKRGVLEYNAVVSDEGANMEDDIYRAKNWDGFLQYIQEEDLSDEVQVDLMSDGIRVTLGESVTFDTYSAELKVQAKEILKKIGQSLKDYTAENLGEIEIQGHTDNRPVKKNARLYKSNWELGSARATSVLEYMVDNAEVAPSYFKASTYGEYHPRTENDSPRGRRQNRRVVIYIRYDESNQDEIPEELPLRELETPKKVEASDGERGSTERRDNKRTR